MTRAIVCIPNKKGGVEIRMVDADGRPEDIVSNGVLDASSIVSLCKETSGIDREKLEAIKEQVKIEAKRYWCNFVYLWNGSEWEVLTGNGWLSIPECLA